MRDLDNLFTALVASAFRRKFRLGVREQGYLAEKGLAIVLQHARDIIDRCLAPASLVKDGSETPFRGHPVYIARRATATCCRGGLEKWHHIPRERTLTAACTGPVLALLSPCL